MNEIDERALEAACKASWEHADDEVGWEAVKSLAAADETYMKGQVEFHREQTRAAILAYEQHRGKQQPVGFVSNCGIGQLEREGWVAISRTPVKTTDIGLYASPQPADIAALREAFQSVDKEDWRRLEGFLDESAHGRFWRSVFADVRTSLATSGGGE